MARELADVGLLSSSSDSEQGAPQGAALSGRGKITQVTADDLLCASLPAVLPKRGTGTGTQTGRTAVGTQKPTSDHRIAGGEDIFWAGDVGAAASELVDTVSSKSLLNAQSMDDGSFLHCIKPEWHQWLLRQRRRMSRTMFRLYMLGQWTVPTPMCDDIAMRYGVGIKRMAKTAVLSILAVRNLTLKTFESKLLAVEDMVRRQIRAHYGIL